MKIGNLDNLISPLSPQGPGSTTSTSSLQTQLDQFLQNSPNLSSLLNPGAARLSQASQQQLLAMAQQYLVGNYGQTSASSPPSSASAFSMANQAQALFQKNQFNDALAEYKKAVALDPSLMQQWQVTYQMGVAAQNSTPPNYAEAKKYYESALQGQNIDPSAAQWMHTQLNGGLQAAQETAQANADFQPASPNLNLGSSDAKMQNVLEQTMAKAPNYTQALQAYQTALQQHPNLANSMPQIFYNLGVSAQYATKPNNTLAVQYYQQYLNSTAASQPANKTLVAWVKQQIAWLPQSDAANKMVQDAQNQFYGTNSNPSAALASLQAAVKKYPALTTQNPGVYLSLAQYAFYAGDVDQAKSYMKQAGPMITSWKSSLVASQKAMAQNLPGSAAYESNRENVSYYQSMISQFADLQKQLSGDAGLGNLSAWLTQALGGSNFINNTVSGMAQFWFGAGEAGQFRAQQMAEKYQALEEAKTPSPEDEKKEEDSKQIKKKPTQKEIWDKQIAEQHRLDPNYQLVTAINDYANTTAFKGLTKKQQEEWTEFLKDNKAELARFAKKPDEIDRGPANALTIPEFALTDIGKTMQAAVAKQFAKAKAVDPNDPQSVCDAHNRAVLEATNSTLAKALIQYAKDPNPTLADDIQSLQNQSSEMSHVDVHDYEGGLYTRTDTHIAPHSGAKRTDQYVTDKEGNVLGTRTSYDSGEGPVEVHANIGIGRNSMGENDYAPLWYGMGNILQQSQAYGRRAQFQGQLSKYGLGQGNIEADASLGHVDAHTADMFYGGTTGSGSGIGGMLMAQTEANAAEANYQLSNSSGSANVGGVHIKNISSVSASGTAALGAMAGSGLSMGIGSKGVDIGAEANAFAGARYGGMAGASALGVGGNIMDQEWNGIGFRFDPNIAFQNGKLSLGLNIGAALGIGGSEGANVTINVDKIGRELDGLVHDPDPLNAVYSMAKGVAGGIGNVDALKASHQKLIEEFEGDARQAEAEGNTQLAAQMRDEVDYLKHDSAYSAQLNAQYAKGVTTGLQLPTRLSQFVALNRFLVTKSAAGLGKLADATGITDSALGRSVSSLSKSGNAGLTGIGDRIAAKVGAVGDAVRDSSVVKSVSALGDAASARIGSAVSTVSDAVKGVVGAENIETISKTADTVGSAVSKMMEPLAVGVNNALANLSGMDAGSAALRAALGVSTETTITAATTNVTRAAQAGKAALDAARAAAKAADADPENAELAANAKSTLEAAQKAIQTYKEAQATLDAAKGTTTGTNTANTAVEGADVAAEGVDAATEVTAGVVSGGAGASTAAAATGGAAAAVEATAAGVEGGMATAAAATSEFPPASAVIVGLAVLTGTVLTGVTSEMGDSSNLSAAYQRLTWDQGSLTTANSTLATVKKQIAGVQGKLNPLVARQQTVAAQLSSIRAQQQQLNPTLAAKANQLRTQLAQNKTAESKAQAALDALTTQKNTLVTALQTQNAQLTAQLQALQPPPKPAAKTPAKAGTSTTTTAPISTTSTSTTTPTKTPLQEGQAAEATIHKIDADLESKDAQIHTQIKSLKSKESAANISAALKTSLAAKIQQLQTSLTQNTTALAKAKASLVPIAAEKAKIANAKKALAEAKQTTKQTSTQLQSVEWQQMKLDPKLGYQAQVVQTENNKNEANIAKLNTSLKSLTTAQTQCTQAITNLNNDIATQNSTISTLHGEMGADWFFDSGTQAVDAANDLSAGFAAAKANVESGNVGKEILGGLEYIGSGIATAVDTVARVAKEIFIPCA